MLVCAAAAGNVLLHATQVAAGPVTTVALSGTQAPGVADGITFKGFSLAGFGPNNTPAGSTIGPQGHVAFYAQLIGNGVSDR